MASVSEMEAPRQSAQGGIKGTHHVALSVSDLDRAYDFYVRIMGMEVLTPPFPIGGEQMQSVMGLPDASGRMGLVRKGGLTLELFEFTTPAPVRQDENYPVSNHGITHFGIDIEDIDAAYERMKAAGVRFHAPVTTFPGGMKATYGRDMDGNVFELLEMSEG